MGWGALRPAPLRAAMALEACGAAAARPFAAASTSRLIMRPCGPEPESALRSNPPALASRRASGEAKMRGRPTCWRDAVATARALPAPGAEAIGAPPAAGPGGLAGAAANGGGLGGSLRAGKGKAEGLSPSARRVAIGVL